jgi:hypothetical protein
MLGVLMGVYSTMTIISPLATCIVALNQKSTRNLVGQWEHDGDSEIRGSPILGGEPINALIPSASSPKEVGIGHQFVRF